MKWLLALGFGVCIEAWLAIAAPAQETAGVPADTTKPASTQAIRAHRPSPTGAMLRSAALPGWGQWYNRKPWKALLVLGAEGGIIANTIYQNQKVQKSQTEAEREFYLDNRRLSNWWLAGAILVSMLDAYVDAQLYDFDESPDLGAVLYQQIHANDYVCGPPPVWFWRAHISF